MFWLGADMGVAVLGHHFRKRSYSMSERLTILKLLGIIDMFLAHMGVDGAFIFVY